MATEVFKNMYRNKRNILAGEDYDLNSCKISKCGKCWMFLTAVGRLETEDDICLYTFTPFLAATLQTDIKIQREV
jgi:hypothetical protein